ncbi:MAG: hypothetical protein EHM18_10935 [Acidobacteria bacterium]|nr:MAG: hypothetical protein EHM18_10935 [Acidobacteriota bacterium]
MNHEDIEAVALRVLELSLELQLKAVRQMSGRTGKEPEPAPRRGRRRQSLVDLSLVLLTEAARPMHVNEVVDQLARRFGRATDRDALSSALAKKARAGQLVRQTAKATFEAIPPEARP